MSALLQGQFKMRIVELKFCFGEDTFATSTNDFDSDGLECLDIMLRVYMKIIVYRWLVYWTLYRCI